MINEVNLIWQLEDFIDNIVDKASKVDRDTADGLLKQTEFLKEMIRVIMSQPKWGTWYFMDQADPPVDGRYIVFQKYLDDNYKEVTTAVWKKGRWCLDTGEYNVKFSSYTMRRQIIAWSPLLTAPLFDEIETERVLTERNSENGQILNM